MKELDALKVNVRKLSKLLDGIVVALDSGNIDHLYDDLNNSKQIVKSFNRSLREIAKTLDKHQEV